VSRLIASKYDLGTVYLSMTGIRSDDTTAYLYRSTDFGATWTSLAHNLPAESINVIREDPRRPHVLYVGTNGGVYVSLDRGATWSSLCADLPTTPVQDLVVHPREDELLIATHGRSLFIMDARPLQAMTPEIASSTLHVFEARPVTLRWSPPLELNPMAPADRMFISISLPPSLRGSRSPAPPEIPSAHWLIPGNPFTFR